MAFRVSQTQLASAACQTSSLRFLAVGPDREVESFGCEHLRWTSQHGLPPDLFTRLERGHLRSGQDEERSAPYAPNKKLPQPARHQRLQRSTEHLLHCTGLTMNADPTIPLLRPAPAPAPVPLSGLQRFAVSTFAIIRIVRGLSFILYPALGLSSFDIPQSGATFLLGSLLGSRDLLLGGLLYTADRRIRREVRRALAVNLLSDAMDTFILIFSAACSWHWRNPLVEIIAVAVLTLLEHLTLWSMSDEEEDNSKGYQTMLQGREDQKLRLDSWLTDLRRAEEQQPAVASSHPAAWTSDAHNDV